MVEKNTYITATVEGTTVNGEGIVRHDGVTFFVPSCLTGEKVRFLVLKVKDKIGYGKLEEVYTPAEERVREVCPVFTKCGGCCLQHLRYNDQLDLKARYVQDTLKKIGGIEYAVPRTVASDRPYAYRNKLQLPVGVDKNGETAVGFYAQRSHRIIPINACAIHPEWAERLIKTLKPYLSVCAVKGYDEEKRTGVLRHVVAREIGGKFIFTLVIAKESLPTVSVLVDMLKKEFYEFSLYLNFNDKDSNVILGERFTLVHGSPFYESEEQGIRFEAGPATFLQVNENVRGKLYKAAVASVVKDGTEVIIDAYSGGGLMTAMLAKKAKRVYGIEIEKEAVRCADSLKAKNKLENMTNICGKTEEHIFSIMEEEKGENLKLVLDPPRAGVQRSVLYAILKSGITSFTMISCNPATLARDLGILTGALVEVDGELIKSTEKLNGFFEIESLQPYDMFPQTKHVETLVCLKRKEKAKEESGFGASILNL